MLRRIASHAKHGAQIGYLHQLRQFVSAARDEPKLVLVVRSDLKMGKGKIASQCAHAAVSAYKNVSLLRKGSSSLCTGKLLGSDSNGGVHSDWMKWMKSWERIGQAKIVVKARSEDELLQVCQKASELHLPIATVRDAGRTEIEAGTLTVAALGPAPGYKLDKVTGNLPLL